MNFIKILIKKTDYYFLKKNYFLESNQGCMY